MAEMKTALDNLIANKRWDCRTKVQGEQRHPRAAASHWPTTQKRHDSWFIFRFGLFPIRLHVRQTIW